MSTDSISDDRPSVPPGFDSRSHQGSQGMPDMSRLGRMTAAAYAKRVLARISPINIKDQVKILERSSRGELVRNRSSPPDP